MEVKNTLEIIKDGDSTLSFAVEAPSPVIMPKQKLLEAAVKKKRRRGKSKRKVLKQYTKIPWKDRRRNDKFKRNVRYRKLVLAKTHAPFNNNQFLMEIHKPEPENNFETLQTPSARTRDSSFSIDSEENYFYSLPEDEEDFLTKEFSSVYEDAQSERLSNMSKVELIQEYLLLEAKYDSLVKRTERVKSKQGDSNKESITDRDANESDSSSGDKDDSIELNSSEVQSPEMIQLIKDQEDQIRELKLANEKLRSENDHLRQISQCSSSEDSESDSSSTSVSCSSSSRSSPVNMVEESVNGDVPIENGLSEYSESHSPITNGFHNSTSPNYNGEQH